MNTVIEQVPEFIAKHLESVASRFDAAPGTDKNRILQDSWLLKKEAFENKMIELGMDEEGRFDPSDERGALFLTYSGSLITVGPLEGGERKLEYTSIGFRTDVPESLELDKAELSEAAETGSRLHFKGGPIKQTSPLFKIVTAPDSLNPEEQTGLVDEAATLIIDTFVEMNKSLVED